MSLAPQPDALVDESSVAGARWRVALISACVLVLELAFIRLVPAEVKAISYFTNLLLMAAFFGLGVGCILQRARSLTWLLPLGLALLFLFTWGARGIVVLADARDVHYWLPADSPGGAAPAVPLTVAAFAAFLCSAMPFIGLGQSLARAMDAMPRLAAYGWDIAGSLAGTALFVAGSWLHVPPWIWPAVAMIAWTVVFTRSLPKRVLYPAAGLVFMLLARSEHPSRWSPYYLVQWEDHPIGTYVYVNSGFHQLAIDFTSKDPAVRTVQETMLRRWGRPYDWYRERNAGRSPSRVLILGAGTGNDVHVALQNGAQQVTAVEIDPVILQLGREHVPTRPYADPRVRAVVDDARHYLRTCRERYDLIVFGTLDSQVLLSGQSNLRLENWVYTAEGLGDARRLLDDGGMVTVYYSVFRPWLWPRIQATMHEAFGGQVRLLVDDEQFLFNTVAAGTAGPPAFGDPPEVVARFEGGLSSTDDWPFIYLNRPTIGSTYRYVALGMAVLVAGAFLLLRRVHRSTGLHANFFLLGLGFSLVEAAAIVRLSLAFGGTWVVNAIVFLTVLIMIFVANAAVMRGIAPSLRVTWPFLLGLVMLNFWLPMPWLLGLPLAARLLASFLLIGAPVFCAAVTFSRLFAAQPTTGYALGINLIGAMAGGVLEYVSMLTGLRFAWLLVAMVYACAWMATLLEERRGAAGLSAT